MIHNKLVRDNIPEIILKNGDIPSTRILDNDEYYLELKKKLVEEVSEFIESDDIVELTDLQEVVNAIIKFKNVSYEQFEELRFKKSSKNGSFDKKIFLIETKKLSQ